MDKSEEKVEGIPVPIQSVAMTSPPIAIQQHSAANLDEPHRIDSNYLSCILHKMQINGTLCDVIFRSPIGDTVTAHRVILAAWSEPFRVMFANGWQESTDSQCEIQLDDEDMAPLRMMIDFMYTGAIQMQTETALPLLALANRYSVTVLQTAAERFIESELNVDNCCLFLTIADRFGCDQLGGTCFEFVVKHFEPVAVSTGFLEVPFAILRDLISSDLLFVRSEEIVYGAVSRWIAADHLNRLCNATEILALVRFPLISTQFLHEVVERDSMVAKIPGVTAMLLEAYRFHAMICEGLPAPLSPGCIERGHEEIIFGDKAGRLCPLSSSMSGNHPLANVRTHDDKYWLPFNSDRAEIMIDLENLYRITKVRLQNRHSVEFEILFKEQLEGVWLELVPIRGSGRHKAITEIPLKNRSQQNDTVGRYVLVRLLGASHSSYHTSIYWIEIHGIRSPENFARYRPTTTKRFLSPL